MFGFVLYIFNLLMVAFVLNWEPAFPPAGSGLCGFVLAELLLKADPVPEAYAALALTNVLFLAENCFALLDDVCFGMFFV